MKMYHDEKIGLASSNFYTISSVIYKVHIEYCAIMDEVCRRSDKDICAWVQWFTKVIEASVDDTLRRVETVTFKAKFWDRHQETALNARQKKVILKMLSVLPEGFEWGMRVNKYMSIAKPAYHCQQGFGGSCRERSNEVIRKR